MSTEPSYYTSMLAGIWSGLMIAFQVAIDRSAWGLGVLDNEIIEIIVGLLVILPVVIFVLGFDALPDLSSRPVGPEFVKFGKAMVRFAVWFIAVVIFALGGMLAVEFGAGSP